MVVNHKILVIWSTTQHNTIIIVQHHGQQQHDSASNRRFGAGGESHSRGCVKGNCIEREMDFCLIQGL